MNSATLRSQLLRFDIELNLHFIIATNDHGPEVQARLADDRRCWLEGDQGRALALRAIESIGAAFRTLVLMRSNCGGHIPNHLLGLAAQPAQGLPFDSHRISLSIRSRTFQGSAGWRSISRRTLMGTG